MFIRGLMGSVSRICFAPDDGGGAGGGAAIVEASAAGAAGAGAEGGTVGDDKGGGAAPEVVKPAVPIPDDLLSTAKAPEKPAETDAEKTTREALEAERANETAEQKTTRETAERERAELLAKETPEEKTKREASEKTADTLKSYDALKVPDGVNADAPLVGAFKKSAAEHGLSTEAAQALMDTVTPELQAAIRAPYETWANTVTQWVADVKADPEIGGAKFEENLGFAAQAIDQFGGPKLREAMRFTGAGANPEFVRFCVRVGKGIAEGGFVGGGAAPEKGVPLSTKMYPSMAKD